MHTLNYDILKNIKLMLEEGGTSKMDRVHDNLKIKDRYLLETKTAASFKNA